MRDRGSGTGCRSRRLPLDEVVRVMAGSWGGKGGGFKAIGLARDGVAGSGLMWVELVFGLLFGLELDAKGLSAMSVLVYNKGSWLSGASIASCEALGIIDKLGRSGCCPALALSADDSQLSSTPL